MKTIDVGKDFYYRLANRNNLQGSRDHTAIEFRKQFLKELDNENCWNNDETAIILDFKNVEVLSPSFANEAFAYFLKYNVHPEAILKKIRFDNISVIKRKIIVQELDSGYKQK